MVRKKRIMQSKSEGEPSNSQFSTVLANIVDAARLLGITEQELSTQLNKRLQENETNPVASLQVSGRRMSNPEAGP
jgi:hypothetical protein